jgi:HK97 family phage major capsid protein
MTLQQVLAALAKAHQERKDILAKGTEENGFTYDKEALKAADAKIAHLEETKAAVEATIKAESKQPVAHIGVGGNEESDAAAEAEAKRKEARDIREQLQRGDLSALRSHANRLNGGVSRIVATHRDAPFRTFGEQMKAITIAGRHLSAGKAVPTEIANRLAGVTDYNRRIGAFNGGNETNDSEGGYLTQYEFQAPMLDNVIESGQIASRCTRISASGPGVTIPRVKENSRADGSRYGGVRAYFVGEGDTIPPSKPVFERVNVAVDKMAVLVPVTEELTQDASFYGGWVSLLGGAEMSFTLDDRIIRGSGQGAPLGILNAPCLVTQAAESAQAAGTVIRQNINKMRARLRPRGKRNAVWLGNQELDSQLAELKDESGKLIYLVGGITGAGEDTLRGRPYIEMEQCSAPGTVGDLIAADLSEYLLIDRGGIQTDVSIHFYFDTAENAMRMLMRVGGLPLPSAPLTPYKGTNTLSPFVALAARA